MSTAPFPNDTAIFLDVAEAALIFARDVQQLWALFTSTLVFFLHLSTIYLASGGSGSTNVMTCLSQTLTLVSVSTVVWWLCGYSLSSGGDMGYGGDARLFIFGWSDRSAATTPSAVQGASESSRFITTLVRAQLVLSHFSLAVTGRMTLPAFAACCAVFSALLIPPVFHWLWAADGWLAPWSPDRVGPGGLDLSGCLAVHTLGGTLGVVAGIVLGPRRLPGAVPFFSAEGRAMREPHDKFHEGVGSLLLWFGYLGLAALSMAEVPVLKAGATGMWVSVAAHAVVFAAVGGACGTVTGFIVSWEADGHFVLQRVLRSGIAALASSSAGSHVSITYAPLVGVVAALLLQVGRSAKHRLRIDDGLDVASLFLLPGIWGALASALFTDSFLYSVPIGEGVPVERGEVFGMQLVAVAAVVSYAAIGCLAALYLLDQVIRVCPSRGQERLGLDQSQHGGVYCDHIKDFSHAASPDRDPASGTEGSTTSCRSPIDGESLFAAHLAKKHSTIRAFVPSASSCARLGIRCLVYAGCLGCVTALSVTSSPDAPPPPPLDINTTAAYDPMAWAVLKAQLDSLSRDLDLMWALLCGMVVFLMQLGFCFLEAGAVRSGSVITIIFKNFSDCSLGALCWWGVGYALAYGGGNPTIGGAGDYFFSPPVDTGDYATFFLSFTYMTTAATIVSGAVAERICLKAYAVIVVFITCLGYPVVVHWIWSDDGWLSSASEDRIAGNGALDFAGGLVIHVFGGVCALGFAWLIGPRKLKDGVDVFSEEGQRQVAAHNRFQQAAGTLLLWFSWFGFNAGSVRSISNGGSGIAANVMVTTLLAGATSCLAGGVVFRVWLGYFDLGHSCNCALVGLVAITAGCAFMSPVYAPVVGVVSVCAYLGIFILRTRLRIDDVVDAGAVHLGGGLWGSLAVGLFRDAERIRVSTGRQDPVESYGLFLGGGGTQLYLQATACAVIVAWTAVFTASVWLLVHHTLGTRVPVEAELKGLDMYEHHAHSYDYIERLEAERTAALDAVRMMHQVAEAMVRFDLSYARSFLQSQQQLSHTKELQQAMVTLVGNLECYRPYLPESLFLEEDFDSDDAADTTPPGSNGQAAIIALDVQDVKQLRNSHPQEARKALRIYEQVVRLCVTERGFYRVDSQGSSFTIACNTLFEALQFTLALQQRLYDRPDWPEALQVHPNSSKASAWNGLRVKAGVAFGAVVPQINFTTGKCTYEGEVAVTAALLRDKAVGGSVAVLSETFGTISPDMHMDMSRPIRVAEGTIRPTEGGTTQPMCMLVPASLEDRKTVVEIGSRMQANSNETVVSPLVPPSQRPPVASPQPPQESQPLPGAFLRNSLATVAQVRMGHLVPSAEATATAIEGVSRVLQGLLGSLERTEGTVVSLCGTSLLAAWNTARRCIAHNDSGIRFAALTHELFKGDAQVSPSMGLATGLALHGKIGTLGQRFVNVFGPCVDLSGHLAAGAEALGTFVLTTSLPGYPVAEENPTLLGAVRPVDSWHLPFFTQTAESTDHILQRKDSVTVYEINLEVVYKREFDGGDDKEFVPQWEWSAGFATSFRQKRWQEFINSPSPVLQRVALMLKNGTNLKLAAMEGAVM